MTRRPWAALLLAGSFGAASSFAAQPLASPDLSGRWIAEFTDSGVTNGQTRYVRFAIVQKDENLTATGPGLSMTGTVRGTASNCTNRILSKASASTAVRSTKASCA